MMDAPWERVTAEEHLGAQWDEWVDRQIESEEADWDFYLHIGDDQ